MAISYKDVRNDRQWKASTGLSEQQFNTLVKAFGEAYEILFGESMVDRQSNSTAQSTFRSYEDLLFFTLYSLKSGLTYDLLGLTFGLEGSNAYQNQALGLRVLRAALERGGHMPKRTYQSVEEFKEQDNTRVPQRGHEIRRVAEVRSIPLRVKALWLHQRACVVQIEVRVFRVPVPADPHRQACRMPRSQVQVNEMPFTPTCQNLRLHGLLFRRGHPRAVEVKDRILQHRRPPARFAFEADD